jgi:hypothetical protein
VPATSIVGSWKWSFISSHFVFEFKRAGNGWTRRYRSDSFDGWIGLQNVGFSDNIVRFSFKPKPSSFTVQIASAGKALKRSVKAGPHLPLPLMLSGT